MSATYSYENLIKTKMRDERLEITNTVLTAVSGACSSTTLSLGLNGSRPLRNDEGTKLLRTLDELIDLADRVAPLRLRFTNAAEIKNWLQLVRDGALFVVVGSTDEEVAADAAADAVINALSGNAETATD